ncbi:MAG TPA: patatin-like protein, partial [Pyrinomonadaceae bacterium]|nr:patatin-like protein [Pyrinomonadaceae bacterium]
MSVPLASGATKPTVDFDQEVRFAVVMYGGSSLAIYINGVAQELLRLVRATAPEVGGTSNGPRQAHLADEELRGPERVYRRLGRLLRRQRSPSDKTDSNAGSSGPIRTRFVVDILTGTSAGGINAVFLAKALANDQNMDKLKNLWVTEGDIGVLINDAESYSGLNFTLTDDTGEPWSLLNSRRMYLALLKALRGMDEEKKAAPEGKSPLVDELDLYVTATDMFGKPIEMRLADDVVSEFRYRNVFQFRYRTQRASDMDHTDFGPQINAFLAFAARATSAHQAAFSPVRLNDVSLITAKNPKAPPDEEFSADAKELRAFYRDYLLQRAGNANKDPEALAKAFQGVWFVDGGTLDNKPFSFVVEELPLRHADAFVDRKLLYIEPSPELSEFRDAPEKRPQIVANAAAALSSLPRYETIVQDLNRLLERNRLVERLDNIMRGMEQDIIYGSIQRHTRDEFLEMLQDPEKLKEWLKSKGSAWGSYLRLRVGEVTDDLTLLVARAAGFSEESDEFLAIRYLVRQWRDTNYDPHMKDGKLSQLQFLVEFDLLWAMRRIRFVLKKLNELSCLSEHDADSRRIARVARGQSEPEVWPAQGEVDEFRKAVQDLRGKLNDALVTLRGKRRTLWSRDHAINPF